MIHIVIAAEKLFSIGPFPVTNTLIMSWLAIIVLIVLSQLAVRKLALVPAMSQNIAEVAFESLLGMMEGILHSRQKAEKYFPFIATIFVMILVSNWMGILPGVGSIGFYEIHDGHKLFVPFFRSLASDLNFTLAIATLAVFMVNVFGMMAQGFKTYSSKFFSFKDPISFFVGLLELLGEFSRIISFSFRLFGNIFAGEVLLIITGALMPFLVPVPFLMLEIFVGFIQALVFSMLTLVFISISIEHHA